MTRQALFGAGVLGVALVFAVQGGEYSTWSWLELRSQERRELAAVDSLERAVDSLEAVAKAVETDPATQERIAREAFGMIKDGEYLIRLPTGRDGP